MEATLQRNIRNSDINVAKEKRVFLTYPANGLVPCSLEEAEESVNFIFGIQGLQPATIILKKRKWEQYRFLVNCADLQNLSLEYDFSLAIGNLMTDFNLIPQVLVRDAKKTGAADFLQCYKALAGSVLSNKYKYEDYLNGGQDLYKKKKLLTELNNIETVEEIKSRLLAEYQQLIKEVNETQKLVPRVSVWISYICIPLLVVALMGATFIGGRMMFVDIPFRDSLIIANTAYIQGDHLGVQQALRDYDLPRLSHETRLFLSRSYVSTEALTEAQRENILIGLSQRTEPVILDYWILLGRLRFDEAIDIAQRLGDDELLLFAYVKYEVFVRQDMSIPGEERMALLEYLVRNIDNMNRARDEAAQNALETTP